MSHLQHFKNEKLPAKPQHNAALPGILCFSFRKLLNHRRVPVTIPYLRHRRGNLAVTVLKHLYSADYSRPQGSE